MSNDNDSSNDSSFMGIGTQCRECGQFILATPAEAVDALCQDCAAKQREPGNAAAAQTAFQVGDTVQWNGVNAFRQMRGQQEGVVNAIKSGGWYRMTDEDGNDAVVHGNDLTLISRAPTPAPAPTEMAAITDRVVRVGDTVRYQCECGYQHEYEGEVTAIRDGDRLTIHAHDGADIQRRASAVEIIARPAPAPAPAQPDGQWVLDLARGMGVPMDQDDVAPPADSEPATPALAATAGAVDTHALELPVLLREACAPCDNTGWSYVHRDQWGNVDESEQCEACSGTGYVWTPRTIRLSDEAVDRLAGELAKRLPGIVRMNPNARGK